MSKFGWDYPPGVTGREFEIAGPDSETEEERTCDKCGVTNTVLVIRYQGDEWWDCDACGASHA